MSESLNLTMIEELKELMEEDFPELVYTYIHDAENRLSHIETALVTNDHNELREQAHGLKGSSSNLGAEKLSAISFELETAGRTQQLELSEQFLQQLKVEFNEVKRNLLSII